ncbi:MAG: hypothetical protein IJN39_05720 [Clostridia bacterium]|nr:hypothetical protein [Clostridia bacterium]
MIKELTSLFCSLPSVSKLTGGVSLDYASGRMSGICIKSDPGFYIASKFLDGSELVVRTYKAELYFSFSGDTFEQIANRITVEEIEDQLLNAVYPEIKEGEIIKISIADGGNAVKSAVGEGLLSFKFSVTYKTRLRRYEYDSANPVYN